MIARTWHATATQENASAYRQHFATVVIPHLRKIAGYAGASLQSRELDGDVEFLAVTLWDSQDSIGRFTGPDLQKAVVEPGAQAVLLRFDGVAANYEITHDDRPARASTPP